MASQVKIFPRKATRRGAVVITGTITLTAAGAISAQDANGCATAAKTGSETGRYTITLDRKYTKPRALGAPGLVGPADAAFGNTDANMAQFRNLATAGDQTFDIQLILASTGADTDGTSGTIIHWAVEAQEY